MINVSQNLQAEGWTLKNADVELFITKQGGQHAPVTFFADSATPVQPYFLSPWQERHPDLSAIPLLQYLRGDFFCLPFGGNGDAVEGIQYQCHGETSANDWSLVGETRQNGAASFTFALDLKRQPGRVEKIITMKDGQSALYLTHKISGLDAKMPYGHHTILRMPEIGKKMYFGAGKFDFGMTPTSVFSDPANWEYQYLANGAEFDRVEAIPTLFKNPATADFSVYPTPVGYADLFALLKKPQSDPAWATAAYPNDGYLFYSLKNAAELPATTVWVSNSGRYEEPWNGVARCFAIEETCSYFADGWKPSISDNALTKKGWKTCGEFKKDEVFTVRHIQGVARIPKEFKKVISAKFSGDQVTFTDENGLSVTAAVDCSFLK